MPPKSKFNGFAGEPIITAIRIIINGITDKTIPRIRLFFAIRGSRSRIQTHEINPPAHPKNIGSNHQAALGLPPWLEYWGECWCGGVNLVLTWPHFGQGEYLDAKAVPQLPQNPPPLEDDNFIWKPH